MTWAEYFAMDAVNWSSLKNMDDSPLHYKYALDHPRADTAQTALGRYVHAAVLDPASILTDFAIWEEGDRRGNAWKEFAAANASKTIFKRSEVDEMAPIIAALRVAMRPYLTSTAQMERILTWTDEATGIRCKCRPDLFDPASRLVLDLKTTRSVDIRRFGHDVARYQYHGQVAHYSAGITAALGWTPEQHILIAVESAPPHDVATFPLDADTLRTGAEKVAALLAQLAECRATNTWPGRYPIPIPLGPANLPPWIFGGGIPEFAFEETA